jgi:hypothetical protein
VTIGNRAALIGSIGLFVLAGGCHGMPDPALTQLFEARRLTTELRLQFSEAVSASDRAVMADTDEASVAYARQAEAAAAAVETGTTALTSRLQKLGNADDLRTLETFAGKFAEYRQVDREVLALAQQNTNLKAQRLSFGPVREAADAFRDALDGLARAAPAKEHARIEAQVARAELDVREIQVLQAPHIAESADAEMSRLESEMAVRQTAARRALEALKAAGGAAAVPSLTAATAALDRFDQLSRQLIALSRQNSNVRSLELALRRQPALTAACDASLAALTDALAKEGFTGTR